MPPKKKTSQQHVSSSTATVRQIATEATAVADTIWKSVATTIVRPSHLVAVRGIPDSREIEVFTVVSVPPEELGIVYLAKSTPPQLYAVVSSKCERDIGGFIVVIDSEEDLQLKNRSPIRAVSCSDQLKKDSIGAFASENEIFVLKNVAPAVDAAVAKYSSAYTPRARQTRGASAKGEAVLASSKKRPL